MQDWLVEALTHLAVGSATWSVLGATALRTLILYFILTMAMRLMGRRLVSQMTSVDMATVATLGAAIGAPMHFSEVGVLSSAIVLCTAVGVYRVFAMVLKRRPYLNDIFAEEPVTLLRNGRIILDAMAQSNISRNHLYSLLRSMGAEHLGQVERVYLEPTGAFAVYLAADPSPGLSILPENDIEIRNRQATDNEVLTCARCGHLADEAGHRCNHCYENAWVRAAKARTASSPQRAIDAAGRVEVPR